MNLKYKGPTPEEIARIAYFLFEERGRKHGHDVEDWLAAEAHVCTDFEHAESISEKNKTNEVPMKKENRSQRSTVR